MSPILETGLACLAPPLAVMVMCLIIVGVLFLINRKIIKD